MIKKTPSNLIQFASETILNSKAKKIVLSGPSGFLGSRVLNSIIEAQQLRIHHKQDPGEVILLSANPGNLMRRLQLKYGNEKMKTIRASRVDYFTQHNKNIWRDQLGSLGLGGNDSVFINLAAVAGPVVGKHDAMMDVNYKAPVAAASACEELEFGHWIQSSTQAVNAERSGQVPYSRAKAMADYSLCHMKEIPVTIACLGLLYCKTDALIGQTRSKSVGLNLIDLSLLPLTPIMGNGSAPLQPQEVNDAAHRIAFLALSNPDLRPIQDKVNRPYYANTKAYSLSKSARYYDAVGRETISMVDMLKKFAEYQGSKFRPVFIDYRNMENVLNISSLGNLNRQFVSLLRSEQDTLKPILGNPDVWNSLLGNNSQLLTLDEAFSPKFRDEPLPKRGFPYFKTLEWVYKNPRVMFPGILLSFEILDSFIREKFK